MYTSIYLTKQKQLDAQKNALMLSQINPHFVYNTLSTIAAMCDTSPKQAKYLTIDFSQYLRRNIGTLASEELIPFEQEMDHVACYLKIEKARFRERLRVSYSIHCKDFYIPSLTVQPLVENAVKHGIYEKPEGGTVTLLTKRVGDEIIISVADTGVGYDTSVPIADDEQKTHVGIKNVRNRLDKLMGATLTIDSNPGSGTVVTVRFRVKR
jgi:sensor histidine kinase YesM